MERQLDFFDVLFTEVEEYPIYNGYLTFPVMEWTKEAQQTFLSMLTDGKLPVILDHDGRNLLTTENITID